MGRKENRQYAQGLDHDDTQTSEEDVVLPREERRPTGGEEKKGKRENAPPPRRKSRRPRKSGAEVNRSLAPQIVQPEADQGRSATGPLRCVVRWSVESVCVLQEGRGEERATGGKTRRSFRPASDASPNE
jgi:hypothetical protein